MAEWWNQPLASLTPEQWEALCDGCARCCMHRFEDEESGAIVETAIACRQLDCSTGRCTQYAARSRLVPRCLKVRELSRQEYRWLPETCAYRLRAEGKPLPDWHPLITGDRVAMNAAGIGMAGRCR
ncbi:MAG: YcgN family cysteine cluster protein, partial [Mariprofundaceae bacterium]